MKKLITIAMALCAFCSANTHGQEVVSGELVVMENVASSFVAPRTVRVWLPPQYPQWVKQGRTIATVFMHDGQMLFDAKTTWNKQEWGVDETLTELLAGDKVVPLIVVGIDNGGNLLRHAEYFPQQPFESLPQDYQAHLYQLGRGDRLLFGGNKVQSDAYLKFIVEELKPAIHAKFKTSDKPQHNALLGSSMGGLISWYGLLEYPQAFARAASISTHWPGAMTVENSLIIDGFNRYIKDTLKYHHGMRWYMDYGNAELDSLYPPLQAKISKTLTELGLPANSYVVRDFPGEGHNENAWRKRLSIPLLYIMGKDTFETPNPTE